MRDLIRNERRLKLCFEGYRFWDMRRWLLAEEFFNKVPEGNYIPTNNFNEFATRTTLDGSNGLTPIVRSFSAPRNYLMPIPYGEVQKNKNLVQNPGY